MFDPGTVAAQPRAALGVDPNQPCTMLWSKLQFPDRTEIEEDVRVFVGGAEAAAALVCFYARSSVHSIGLTLRLLRTCGRRRWSARCVATSSMIPCCLAAATATAASAPRARSTSTAAARSAAGRPPTWRSVPTRARAASLSSCAFGAVMVAAGRVGRRLGPAQSQCRPGNATQRAVQFAPCSLEPAMVRSGASMRPSASGGACHSLAQWMLRALHDKAVSRSGCTKTRAKVACGAWPCVALTRFGAS
jgi:hypothetical protein